MEVNIHEPRSRAFTIILRYLHLGLNLIIAMEISKINSINCSNTMLAIGEPVSLILIAVSIIAIIILRFKEGFDRRIFFVGYAIDVILAGVAMVVGFGEVGESNSCAGNKILHLFVGVQALVVIAISITALLSPFQFAQRYCNAPGNFSWVILFLAYPWTSAFSGGYITVGLLNLLICIATLAVNLIPFLKGMTKIITKVIRIQWLASLGLMIICLIIVFAVYMSASDATAFQDEVGKKLAQTYIPINIIDGIFWIWGLATLKNSKGDTVRDNIIGGNVYDNNDENDLDNYGEQGIGTIK